MSDLKTSSDGKETSGVKKDFTGEIVNSEVNATEERFQTEYESDFDIFFEIEPLTEYEKRQYVLGLDVSESWGSKWQIMMAFLENLHGPLAEKGVTTLEELADFLVGNVYEFRELDFDSDAVVTWEHAPNGGHEAAVRDLFPDEDYRPDPLTVPVREITDSEELAELGVEDAGDVEEIDF